MKFKLGDRVRFTIEAHTQLRVKWPITRIGTIAAKPLQTESVVVRWDGSRAINASSYGRYSVNFLEHVDGD